MEIKENNIIFLIGAGCSKEADIPISNEMVSKLQDKLSAEPDWKKYQDLYFYLKSSIEYSEGIFGNFESSFNIEKLLIVMAQLEQRDKNIFYPFIGSWNIRLPEVAGDNFEKITELKRLINRELYEWVTPKDLIEKASYYSGFKRLSNEIGKPLKIFSLNYDQCFEKVIGEDDVNQGFDPKTFEWQQSNFEADNLFKLYKLHGSINWYSDKHTGKLMYSNHPVLNPELIFGIDTKLRSSDPYLYFTSEFRGALLSQDCKLIVTIGYSYADDYINNLISQALINNPSRKVLNITKSENENNLKENLTSQKLDFKQSYNKHCKNQFDLLNISAKTFLNDNISADFLSKFIIDDTDAPFK